MSITLTNANGQPLPKPKPVRHAVSDKDFVRTMLIARGIHEGTWSLYVTFGLAAQNIPTKDSMMPAAVMPVLEFGFEACEPDYPGAVNAAEVNPR